MGGRKNEIAEAEGFEPSDQFPGRLLSRKPHSTALPRLRASEECAGRYS